MISDILLTLRQPLPHPRPCLQQRYCDHEPGRWAAGVAVVVPLPVNLPGQGLVCHVADQSLGEVQPLLLQQGLAAEPAVALQDGLAEAVGPLVAHLHRKQGRGGGSEPESQGSPIPFSQPAHSLDQAGLILPSSFFCNNS